MFKHQGYALIVLLLSNGCQDAADQNPSESVGHQLETAENAARAGRMSEADSILKIIYRMEISKGDSLRASIIYVPVLVALQRPTDALYYVDQAYPDSIRDAYHQMRRSSYRFQALMQLGDCPSIKEELRLQFDLVKRHGDLQLGLKDLIYNQKVVARRCQ